MKVYQIFMNDDAGFTSNNIEGVVIEVNNIADNENRIIDTLRLTQKIAELEIGEFCGITFEEVEIRINCFEMSEEDYNSLSEFTGW